MREGKEESSEIPHVATSYYPWCFMPLAIPLAPRRFSTHLLHTNQGYTQHSYTHTPMLNGHKLYTNLGEPRLHTTLIYTHTYVEWSQTAQTSCPKRNNDR